MPQAGNSTTNKLKKEEKKNTLKAQTHKIYLESYTSKILTQLKPMIIYAGNFRWLSSSDKGMKPIDIMCNR